jgi:hypothetical protein
MKASSWSAAAKKACSDNRRALAPWRPAGLNFANGEDAPVPVLQLAAFAGGISGVQHDPLRVPRHAGRGFSGGRYRRQFGGLQTPARLDLLSVLARSTQMGQIHPSTGIDILNFFSVILSMQGQITRLLHFDVLFGSPHVK